MFYDFLTILGVNKPILVWPAFPFSNYMKEKSSLKGEVMLKWGIESLAKRYFEKNAKYFSFFSRFSGKADAEIIQFVYYIFCF